MPDELITWEEGDLPIAATAIHNGHAIRAELHPYLELSDEGRLREEDPFTGDWTVVAPTRVIVNRSRFEVDLNRPRDKAVYLDPEDAWGLKTWKSRLPQPLIAGSLAVYDGFYSQLDQLYTRMAARHGRFVVLDLHSYNHRRAGPQGELADAAENPQVNIGTGTLLDPAPWTGLIKRFIDDLSAFDFPGGHLDVRENVKFRGGHCSRWAHTRFPGAVCVLSVELKKFFMDEWSGEMIGPLRTPIIDALRSTVPGLLEELRRGAPPI